LNYKIITIESRKGGVGKTTAALNLAKLLLNQKYVTLLLDIDITGTNIAYALDSSFWRGTTNQIKYKNQNANLLEVFQDLYMNNKKLPAWLLEQETDTSFNIKLKEINIIGSNIFNDSNSGKKLICKPNILFDELHTFWFKEFLKEICETFAQKVKNKKVAIIFDNSPGFIGINPIIQDWLTDIGPIRGKFLTISSLDKQDIISCSKAVEEIHSLYTTKYKAAKIFFKLKGDDFKENLELSNDENKFFLRLATKNLDKDSIDYYNDLIVKDDETYVLHPDKYQAIIVNKVPNEIRNQSFSYNFNKLWDILGNSKTISNLLGYSGRRKYENFVYYDEYINFQFSETSITRSDKRRYQFPQKNLIKNFEKLDRLKIKKVNYENFDNLIQSQENFESIVKNINILQAGLVELLDKLTVYGYNNIVRLINKEWYPKTPYDTLNQFFTDIIYYTDYYKMEFDMFHEPEKFNFEFFENFCFNIESKDEKFFAIPYDDLKYKFSFRVVLYLTLRQFNLRMPFIDEFSEFFSSIQNMQIHRMRRNKKSNDIGFSLQNFLINEQIDEEQMDNKEFHKFFRRLHIHPEIRETFSIDFYNSFCKAQARIIDLDNDFEFLIYILRLVTCESDNRSEDEIIFPYIRDILNKVILFKTIPHSIAREEASKGFKSANYMSEFQDVLSTIIKKWEVV
jgi:hypothetical protein